MTASPLLEFLPDAIAAGDRAYQRATKLRLPDGKPEPLGLATPAVLMPATLAVLLDAAQQLQASLEGCADGSHATAEPGTVTA